MRTYISRALPLSLFACLALPLVAGCDDDDSHRASATPTPIASSTATPTATPTPQEHHGPPHSIMRVGSTQATGGKLTVDTVPIAFVADVACLGGTGDECTGGTVVYQGDSPGFNDLTADDPSLPIYRLPEGVQISIEITAIEPNASALISGVLLDTVGETAVVNTTGHLHNHPIWQTTAPGGQDPEERHLSFRLHAPGYETSDEIPITIELYADTGEEPHGHD